ncbi:argininosuccinate lyase [Defluviimonas sp. WL0050]|uniref:Argininosuccinate lyase n=1 Tax=Albidovulum litorale TaxID=2984134 RepID=A0ABT2ZSU9_9RHOB|nr:argininosuccinate lyase [Defluviimonas sp. WL0050]
MRICLSLLIAATLAACGADGEPTPPAETGVTVSGQVKVGVGGNL